MLWLVSGRFSPCLLPTIWSSDSLCVSACFVRCYYRVLRWFALLFVHADGSTSCALASIGDTGLWIWLLSRFTVWNVY